MICKLKLGNYWDPEIEIINGKNCYIDIVSNTPRPANPEEYVRQKFVKFMHKKLGIPFEAMLTEESMSHYLPGNNDKMDICVKRETNSDTKILMVVECKAQDVQLTEEVYNQIKRYAEPLKIPILIVTNGVEYDCIMRNSDNTYEDILKLPHYEELANYEDIQTVAIEEYDYQRWSYDELHREDVLEMEYNMCNHITRIIDKEKAINCINIAECFLDVTHKIKDLPLKNYTFINDEAIYNKKAGNPGVIFVKNFRLVKIKDTDGNILSIGFAVGTDPYPKIFVGTYFKRSFHNALELNLSQFMDLNNGRLQFTHDYQIYHRNKEEFKDYVNKKKLFEEDGNGNIILGNLDASKLLYCDDTEVMKLMANLIEYSILRDKFRLNK